MCFWWTQWGGVLDLIKKKMCVSKMERGKYTLGFQPVLCVRSCTDTGTYTQYYLTTQQDNKTTIEHTQLTTTNKSMPSLRCTTHITNTSWSVYGNKYRKSHALICFIVLHTTRRRSLSFFFFFFFFSFWIIYWKSSLWLFFIRCLSRQSSNSNNFERIEINNNTKIETTEHVDYLPLVSFSEGIVWKLKIFKKKTKKTKNNKRLC